MSLTELLNTNIISKPWMDIYTDSLTTNNLTVNGSVIISGPITITGLLSVPGGITGSTASFNTLTISGLSTLIGGINGGTASFTYGNYSQLLSLPAGVTGATSTFTTISLTGTGLFLPSVGATTISALNYYEDQTITLNWTGAITTSSDVRFIRVGKQVTAYFVGNTVSNVSNDAIVTGMGAIPTRFLPPAQLFYPGTVLNNSINANGAYEFYTDGTIKIYATITKVSFAGGNSGYGGLCFSWLVT